MIRIKHLNKKYGFNHVLKDINLEFEKGKVYGIVGENGAGKTTLFRCIAGLEDYDGEIESDIVSLKNYLGFLMTEPFFFDLITGKEYIQLHCNARKREVNNIDEKNIFDLPLEHYVSTYSTGMKKKLALLAILLQNNQYFLLDEPFNGVDIHSNIIIVEVIKKLREMGKLVIVASHIFSTLSDTCDEITLLSEGKIVKTVKREEFEELESEMKEFSVGDKIEKLGISC